MTTATIRFYGELNDYLSPQLRQRDIELHFAPPCPVRHLLETQGVPHTEIETVAKQEVEQRLGPETIASFDEFWRCAGCDRVYWKGSHYDRLQKRVAAVIRRASG